MPPSASIARLDINSHTRQPSGGSRVTVSVPNGHPTSPSSTTSASSDGLETPPHSANGSTTQSLPTRNGAHRKDSSPLMPAFMVSAPGKVIVYGEHAVVHGKAAIAASISLRSYLLCTFRSKSNRTVSLRFPDIQFDHTWTIDSLPWAAFAEPSKKKTYYDLVTSLDPDLVAALQPYLRDISPNVPEATRKIHHSSAFAFLYLFLSLGSQKSAPCVYTLRSTIPIGAGLGSSATIAVCLATALLLQIRALSGPHPDQPADESHLQVERINRWAFVAEMCIHGNPSGVDNTVSAGGKAVHFKRPDYRKPPVVTSLRDFPELPLLLVNTRQSRSTSTEVQKVANLRKTHPEIANLILDAIDSVTESAHEMISDPDFDSGDPANLQHLGELITMNHGLLVSLGVSHPKLERIRALIDHTGIGWTKLTGAGGGGCAITILKPSSYQTSPENSTSDLTSKKLVRDTKQLQIRRDLEEQLVQEGFEIFPITLGGDGVGILWPAVLHNASGEEGGEAIDQEKFLKAEGNKGIEQLVGVNASKVGMGLGMEEEREGWKFWRV